MNSNSGCTLFVTAGGALVIVATGGVATRDQPALVSDSFPASRSSVHAWYVVPVRRVIGRRGASSPCRPTESWPTTRSPTLIVIVVNGSAVPAERDRRCDVCRCPSRALGSAGAAGVMRVDVERRLVPAHELIADVAAHEERVRPVLELGESLVGLGDGQALLVGLLPGAVSMVLDRALRGGERACSGACCS